ncbi:MAG: baseplate protein, partial [Chitinophagia bacterium]|nr:baseplate protein [Chitinophagia bacterium]
MALPKLSYPTFEVTIPSTNKTIKMRPFLVREEKILLVAQQTEEPKEVVNAIKQVIVNCSIDQFNVEDLTTFDLEFLFIKLRARSVNSVIKLRYRDNEDNQSYDVECDLDQVEIVRTEGHTNIIQINDNMTMVMKYPRAELMQTLDPSMNESEI